MTLLCGVVCRRANVCKTRQHRPEWQAILGNGGDERSLPDGLRIALLGGEMVDKTNVRAELEEQRCLIAAAGRDSTSTAPHPITDAAHPERPGRTRDSQRHGATGCLHPVTLSGKSRQWQWSPWRASSPARDHVLKRIRVRPFEPSRCSKTCPKHGCPIERLASQQQRAWV